MTESPKNIPRSPAATTRKGHAREVIGILLMVSGLLITSSIVAYTRNDEPLLEKLSATDLIRLIYNSDVKAAVSGIKNHFGLLGALVSNFFINSTVGYISLLIPLLMLSWGWLVLRRLNPRKFVTLTNYAIILLLLFSTSLGVLNLIAGGIRNEWSGAMGAFLADLSANLFGATGAAIVLCTLIFIAVVFAIDLDIHRTLDRLKTIGEGMRGRISKGKEFPEIAVGTGTHEEYDEPAVRQEPPRRPPPERSSIDIAVPDGQPGEIPGEEMRETDEAVSSSALPSASDEAAEIDYVFPSVELLDPPRQIDIVGPDELKGNAELVREKLAHFGVEIESVSVTPGPVITLYELVPATGVKISRIVNLADDLALALAARGIRIIAPIPGKSAVGVEIPNKNPSIVYLRSVLNSTRFRESKASLPIALGKTISGEVYTDDLAKMPHLLIAGSTGSGKSVGINTILAGLLFRLHPSDVKFILIDPKKIELTSYGNLRNHFLAVSPDIAEEIATTPASSVSVLKSVELEMEKRYDRLAAAGVRNIQDYNERQKAGRLRNTEAVVHTKMPYLVVVIDELADLMMTAAREVEEPIARLAQLARAVGIHLVLATQRPSVDVITGVIKANFPSRIAYQVASKTDSRTILDMNGAEQLLGSGDMLYLPSGSPKPVRIQSAFVSSDEVERMTEHIGRQQGYPRPFQLPSILERKRSGFSGSSGSRDDFFEEAARLIVRHQQGSVSLLQRRLKVGYSRAARLVDELEAAGIVGPFDGSKARTVLIESDDQLESKLKDLD